MSYCGNIYGKAVKYIKSNPILFLIILLGGFFRFYKLDWGEGFFFHPDEYHIVISVNQLSFPSNMHPHLFSYGSFSVYLIYFSKLFIQKIFFILNNKTSGGIFNPFLIGRFYSALFSTLTILTVHQISTFVFRNKKYSLLSALLVALTPGLIQQAHYATPDSSLTFFIFLSILFFVKWYKQNQNIYYLLSSAAYGLALSTKITAISILPIFLILTFYKLGGNLKNKDEILNAGSKIFLFILVCGTFFFMAFPYSFIDLGGFRSSMNYELPVGRGTLPVFYTRQFINTSPLIFQLSKILPYALGLTILIFSIPGILQLLYSAIKNPKKDKIILLSLLAFFLVLFLPNNFLFAKWTRFILPTFPFFSIFSVYFFYTVEKLLKPFWKKYVFYGALIFLTLPTFLWIMAFFRIYTKQDVRITATEWVLEHIPKYSYILTETGNTLEVPLYGMYPKNAFNFYDLDENPHLPKNLANEIARADYFIIQSRRIYANHLRFPEKYPLTYKFYNALFSGDLGFKQIAEFNSFPSLEIRLPVGQVGKLKMEINDEQSEETFTVFDHPVIRIYQKTTNFSPYDYEQIIKK